MTKPYVNAGDRVALSGALPSASRAWIALAILLVVYILNFMDRWVITILLQPIKEELLLADWQLDHYPLNVILPSGRFIPVRVRTLVNFLANRVRRISKELNGLLA